MGGLDLVLMFMLLSKPSKPEYFQLSQSHSDDEWTIRVALFDQAVDTKSGQLLSLINEHIFTFFGFQSVEPLIQISKTLRIPQVLITDLKKILANIRREKRYYKSREYQRE